MHRIYAEFEFWTAIATILILAALAFAEPPAIVAPKPIVPLPDIVAPIPIDLPNDANGKAPAKPLKSDGLLAQPANPMVELKLTGLAPVVAYVNVESVLKNRVRLQLMIVHSTVEERTVNASIL